jgi:type I restriction enzyme M protein
LRGVKTNLAFFMKGLPAETIWYYDLSDLKVGTKTPLTQVHFDDFYKLLPTRGTSERSWTIPFAARLHQAPEEALPFRERVADLSRQAAAKEDAFKERRKTNTASPAERAQLEDDWKRTLRESREALARAESIENAVCDLKAVNPNRPSQDDRRTPEELLALIAEKGREADAALDRLRMLIAARST